jgi:hypothetical protein
MTPPNPIVPQKVTKWQLREMWNDPAYQAQMRRRTTERVMIREDLAPPGAEQVPGALSRIYDIWDNTANQFLGTFHCYRNPDGSIGASGKEDPIWLLVNGVLMCDP